MDSARCHFNCWVELNLHNGATGSERVTSISAERYETPDSFGDQKGPGGQDSVPIQSA